MDLGNTRDECHSRSGDFRSVVSFADRDQGGKFGIWSWQEMEPTIRQVRTMSDITRNDGKVYLGSIPKLHYAEMLRYQTLEQMDDETWQEFVRAYLCHSSFKKFKSEASFMTWSPHNWFFDLLYHPKDLTAFYARRKKELWGV